MKLLLYFILLAIVILIYVLVKQLKQSILITLVCSIFIIYFILYPELCITSTIGGVKLFFSSVFPSLFSFLIMCNLLLSYDGVKVYSKLLGRTLCSPLRLPQNCGFVLLVSALCGNPLGAKYSIDLYERKAINKEQCQRLLNIASNAGPLFIVGAVGTAMLKSPQIGYILLIANYISCIAMGILIPSKSTIKNSLTANNIQKTTILPNLGNALRDSIENAIKTTLSVGGYITIFYVIIDIIGNNFIYIYIINLIPDRLSPLKEITSGTILGLIELTKGCFIISQNSINSVLKIFIIGFFMGFSGLSIITQIYSFTSRYPEFRIKLFIKRKFIQGIIGGISSSVIYMTVYYRSGVQQTMSTYTQYKSIYISAILVLILTPALLYNIRKIFKSN